MPRRARGREAAVAGRLHTAALHLLRYARRSDAALGVGPAALSALSVLVFGGPRTLSELAAVEQVRAPTMSRIVTGLERAGLALRVPDPADRRAVRIRATPAGRRMLHRGRAQRVARLSALLDGLHPRELDELGRAAELIETVLQGRRGASGT